MVKRIRLLFLSIMVALSLSSISVNAFAESASDKISEDIKFFWEIQFSGHIPESYDANLYWRYIDGEFMAQVDWFARQYGASLFFEGLESDNPYVQYFCINKLVEYYNDVTIRNEAIEKISPFLNGSGEKIQDAAQFALDILTQKFNSEYIVHMADGSMFFTLFNNYSDYGSYHEMWEVKDGELLRFWRFNDPSMYITDIIPSPDGKNIAVSTCNNKSEYMIIFDLENGLVRPELVDSARIKLAADKNYTYWQRSDYNNYSGIRDVQWTSVDEIEFSASLAFDGAETVENVSIKYNYVTKSLEYESNYE